MGEGNQFSEQDLIEAASLICSWDPGEIYLIGGTLALPEIAGYKRLRRRSDDLDFIVTDKGLQAVIGSGYPIHREAEFKDVLDGEGCYATHVNGILAAFFHKDLRGVSLEERFFIDTQQHHTQYGPVHTVCPEVNLALKMRRGLTSKGRIFGKDALDAATMSLGANSREEGSFHAERFGGYVNDYVCDDCPLERSIECMDPIAKASGNLPPNDRPVFERIIQASSSELTAFCRYE